MNYYSWRFYWKNSDMITRIQWDYIETIKLPLILLTILFNMIRLNTLKLIDNLSRKNYVQDLFVHLMWRPGNVLRIFWQNECPVAFLILIQHCASWACETSLPQLEGKCWKRKLTSKKGKYVLEKRSAEEENMLTKESYDMRYLIPIM